VIDPKLLRSDPEAVARNMARRGLTLDVEAWKALEEKRKPFQIEVDRLRSERNANAKAVGMAKSKGADASELMARSEALGAELTTAEQALTAVQEEQTAWQMGLPNWLHESVPDGADEKANVEVRRWGQPRNFDFEAGPIFDEKKAVFLVREEGRIRAATGRGVLVKVPKSGQDLRFDLPTIGPRTLEGVARAGLAGIAVVAGNTIAAEPQAMISLADAKYLFVIGLTA